MIRAGKAASRNTAPRGITGVSSVLGLVSAMACSAGSDGGGEASAGAFLAFASDFAGYQHWQHVGPESSSVAGSVHARGPMTVYWNQNPEHQSESFALGTIIVKEASTDSGTSQTFAMVKRGANFNATGATGWEWFELQPNTATSVTILWRGVGPPTGESYGGDPTTCNNCHAQAAANDFVWSPALQLGAF